MEEAFRFGLMVPDMMANGQMIKLKGMEGSFRIQLMLSMRAIGNKTRSMEKVQRYIKTKMLGMKVTSMMDSRRERER